MIDTSQASNSGNYTCKTVTLTGESWPSRAVNVEVLSSNVDNPIISSTPTRLPSLGDDLILTCHLIADEDHHIRWEKDSEPLLATGRALQLRALTEEDNGFYTCWVSDRQSQPYILPLRTPLKPKLYFSAGWYEARSKSTNSVITKTFGAVYQRFSEGQDVYVRCQSFFHRVDRETSSAHTVPGRTYQLYKDGQLVDDVAD